MDIKSNVGIWQTLLPLPPLRFREMESDRGTNPDSGVRMESHVYYLDFPARGDLLPEVSWDLVNILNHTRRGLYEPLDCKILN